jgi:putative phage-type endonuclease
MDPIYELINIINTLIKDNNDAVKIENIIINNPLYNNLDMDEKSIILDSINEKINKVNIINTTENIPKYSYNKSSFYDMNIKKPYYKKKENDPTIFIKNSEGNMITEGEAMSSKTIALVLSQISEEEFNRRANIFEKIRAIILPEQRSPEWFAMRHGKITASDGGAVLGENKHEPSYNFILKKVLGSNFETNLACYHGKKFEQVVTMMYEYKNDVHTEEFGLLGHPDYYFLGASPDGICSPYHRDMKTPHHLVGRMLEIKCPLMRKIKYQGDIKDTICPIYYWCQVQLQLECCNLDECDFIQCNIEEYKTREEWLEDTNPECDYKTKKYGLEKGVIIQLLSNKLTEDDYIDGNIKDTTIYNSASFIYPPKIDMSLKEIDNWILTEIHNLENKPHLRLHRVIYWRLIENNCTLILRDKEWFAKNLDKLRTMWGYVEYLRENNDTAQKWKEYIDNLPKKYNDKIINKLIEFINEKKNLNIIENKIEDKIEDKIEEEIILPNIKRKYKKNKISINT